MVVTTPVPLGQGENYFSLSKLAPIVIAKSGLGVLSCRKQLLAVYDLRQ